MKQTLKLGAAWLLLAALSACNTMEGLGQDIQKSGEKLEKSADENKNY